MSITKKNNTSKVGEILGKILKTVTMVFIALRACDVIVWPWFWVLSPMLLAWAIAVLCFLFVGAAAAVVLSSENKD
jgi:fatty acid desaturase